MSKVTALQPLPYNYKAIVKDDDSPINKSEEHLFGHLYDGILLNQKERYWIDKKSNNCFLVYARDLKIRHGNYRELNRGDRYHWQWPSLEETSNVFIDAAELLYVSWLNVRGVFDTTAKLTPGIMYEVAFVVMLKASGSGWEIPVNVRLSLNHDGSKQQHKVNLMEKARGQWIEIPVGEFKASLELGEIEFSMYKHDQYWKTGLVIKGVAVQPKKERER